MIGAWAVTYDHLEGKESKVSGPRGVTLSHSEIVNHPDAQKFRMLDDDGNVYYTGFCIVGGEYESDFAPLDDYGAPNAGCTGIQYQDGPNGSWEYL